MGRQNFPQYEMHNFLMPSLKGAALAWQREAMFPEQRGSADATSAEFYVPNRFASLHSWTKSNPCWMALCAAYAQKCISYVPKTSR